MDSNHITVVYKWTAQPGKLDELTSIYAEVTDAMEQNEPGAEAVHIYVSEQDNALYVRDEFADAAAMGFHLGTHRGCSLPAAARHRHAGTVLLPRRRARGDEAGDRADAARRRVRHPHRRVRSLTTLAVRPERVSSAATGLQPNARSQDVTKSV